VLSLGGTEKPTQNQENPLNRAYALDANRTLEAVLDFSEP